MTTRRKAGGGQRKKAAPRRKAASRAPTRVTAARATFPADFTIAQAPTVQKQLARMFAKPTSITLDLSSVRRIDTAGLQLLTAFIRERRAAGREVRCAGVSESFTVTAQMLGLGAVFA